MKKNINFLILLFLVLAFQTSYAEDGYRLWQRYETVKDQTLLENYRKALAEIVVYGNSPTVEIIKTELEEGLNGLLGKTLPMVDKPEKHGLVVGTPANSKFIASLKLDNRLADLGDEGY